MSRTTTIPAVRLTPFPNAEVDDKLVMEDGLVTGTIEEVELDEKELVRVEVDVELKDETKLELTLVDDP